MMTLLRQFASRATSQSTFLGTVAELLSHSRAAHGIGPSRKLAKASLRQLCQFSFERSGSVALQTQPVANRSRRSRHLLVGNQDLRKFINGLAAGLGCTTLVKIIMRIENVT